MTDPNSMTGYDAATVEACAARLDALLRTGNDLGAIYRNATITQSQEAIRALPIAHPAPSPPVESDADAARAENVRLRAALFNATALIGHKMPMDTFALIAGEMLIARDVWSVGVDVLKTRAAPTGADE